MLKRTMGHDLDLPVKLLVDVSIGYKKKLRREL